MKLLSLLKKLRKVNVKTIYFNLKYLPFKQAIKFPFLIANGVYLHSTKGKVAINGEISTGLIRIGHEAIGIFDHKRSRSVWNVSGTVVFNGKTHIGHGSKISVDQNATLSFGKNLHISAESSIHVAQNIEIGDDCMISWDVLIMDTDFHKIKDKNKKILNLPKEVIIGNKTWIGCRCLILKSSIIPDNSVIAADSRIGGELIGEHQIFAGNPAKAIKSEISWER